MMYRGRRNVKLIKKNRFVTLILIKIKIEQFNPNPKGKKNIYYLLLNNRKINKLK